MVLYAEILTVGKSILEEDNKILVTCEHAGNRVPDIYEYLFKGREQVLETHRGFDPGALELAEGCAARLNTTPEAHLITRLLVDVNRSLSSRSLFSEFTSPLPVEEKQFILDTWYEPYRKQVETRICNLLAHGKGKVLHLGIHTFTNMLRNQVRTTDIGLLYDPSRPEEKEFCELWRSLLKDCIPMDIRFNYPYRGVADGLVTHLRKQFSASRYIGIELEVNQKFHEGDTSRWRQVREALANTLREAFGESRIEN